MNAVVISIIAVLFTFPTFGRSAPLIPNIPAALSNYANGLFDPRLSFCNTDRFHASFKGPDDQEYYFRGHAVFIVKKNEKVELWGRAVIFPKSPYYVNAMVYSHNTGRAYLFKDRKVWVYQYRAGKFTYLQTKRLGRTTPNIVEAAFFYRGSIYLLKGGYLYAWDERSINVIPNHVFSTDYFWKGVPKQIDAAMQFKDDKTLFWKWQPITKMQYYLFDNQARKMVKSGSFISFFPFCAS